MGSSEPLGDVLLHFGYLERFYAFGLVVEEKDARSGDCTARSRSA
jgi:hypothetical protein